MYFYLVAYNNIFPFPFQNICKHSIHTNRSHIFPVTIVTHDLCPTILTLTHMIQPPQPPTPLKINNLKWAATKTLLHKNFTLTKKPLFDHCTFLAAAARNKWIFKKMLNSIGSLKKAINSLHLYHICTI